FPPRPSNSTLPPTPFSSRSTPGRSPLPSSFPVSVSLTSSPSPSSPLAWTSLDSTSTSSNPAPSVSAPSAPCALPKSLATTSSTSFNLLSRTSLTTSVFTQRSKSMSRKATQQGFAVGVGLINIFLASGP